MKRILLDFARRWRWAYVLAGLAQLGGLAGLLIGQKLDAVFIGELFTVMLAPCALSWELLRGSARVLRILPVASRETARAWWFLAVGVPVLAQAGLFVLAALVEACFPEPGTLTLSWAARGLWLTFAWAGTLHFLMIYSVAGPQQGFRHASQGAAMGALWGLSLNGGLFMMTHFIRPWNQVSPWAWVVLLVATALAIGSWFKAETLVERRAAFRPTSAPVRRSYRLDPSAGPRWSGLPYLWWTVGWQSLTFPLALAAAISLVQWLILGAMQVPLRPATQILSGQFLAIGCMMALLLGLRWVQSLRALRILPLSTRNLSLHLFLLPLLPCATLAALQYGLAVALGESGPFLRQARLLPCLLGLIPCLIGLGLWRSTVGPLVVVAMLSGIFVPVAKLPLERLPWTLSLAIGGLLLAVGYLTCHWLIARRSEGYRPLRLGWGNWGVGAR